MANSENITTFNLSLSKVFQVVMGVVTLATIGWVINTSREMLLINQNLTLLIKADEERERKLDLITSRHTLEIHNLQIQNEAHKLNMKSQIKLEELVRANSLALTNLRITIESRYRINEQR
tara:strand:- start:147 stop:509 length:363 start_codon:yes stop_codon:yes gene_type:complete